MTDTEVIDGIEGAPIETDEADAPTIRLFPDVFVPGVTAAVLLLCLYSILCIFVPAALDVRANTITPPSASKPAWYFLFLYRYLRSAPPGVGAMTPVLMLVLLGAWPFLDHNPSREPRKRVAALTLAGCVVLAIAALSYMGWTTQL